MESNTLTCNLPGDIMFQILYRLPFKSVLRFKCVNKSWFSLTKDPIFVDMHYYHWYKLQDWEELVLGHDREESEIGILYHGVNLHQRHHGPTMWEPMGIYQPEKLKLVGLSKGLICLTPLSSSLCGCEFVVINPALRQSKITTQNLICESKRRNIIEDHLSFGFGFHQKEDDFKIVRVELLKGLEARINIYSLYGDSWRQINCLVNFTSLCNKGVLSSNSMYWSFNIGKGITCFDLTSDRFCSIPLPPTSDKSHCWQIIPWESDSIAIILYEPDDDNTYWLWTASPTEDRETTWTRDSLVFVDEIYKSPAREKIIFRRIFPGYKNIISIGHYKESLVPVKRTDHYLSNVVQRLKDALWIRYADEDS